MDEIKSITEAYSMQPESIYVFKIDKETCISDKPYAVKEIKLENVIIGDYPQTAIHKMMYICYNHEGKKLAQYLADSVNVKYYAE